MSNKVVIYGRPSCPFCARAKALAEELQLDFDYRNIEVDATAQSERAALADKYDHHTVPLILVAGQFIGGFDNFAQLHASGELDGVLTGTATADASAAVDGGCADGGCSIGGSK